MDLFSIYRQLGLSQRVWDLGREVADGLRERFREIDAVAEFNQAKVLLAMQESRIGANHFAATTGYGYNDDGRERLEQVYAGVFHSEAALVRPQITCGTHALTVALSANLLPGDELLSPVGLPYDTLQEVIGIRPSPCSLAEYGVTYRQVELLADGSFDYEGIRAANREIRQIDCATDVLSFPMLEFAEGSYCGTLEQDRDPETGRLFLGDVLISLERARAQAEEFGHSAERECAYLTVHSILHLLGYDHVDEGPQKAVMRAREEEALSSIGLKREG